MTQMVFLRTNDGDVIKITQDMLEDFYVISSTYNVSITDLISTIFGSDYTITNTPA